MDQIYKIYSRQASPKICVKNYFQQYSELLKSFLCHNLNEQSDEKIFQLMDVDLPQARTLLIKHYCRYFITRYTKNITIFSNKNEKRKYILIRIFF